MLQAPNFCNGLFGPTRRTLQGKMASFSGAIKLSGLNDFIAPSQACVVTLSGGKIPEEVQTGEVILQHKSAPNGFTQTKSEGPDGAIKVTLHDCLACSGCVTSAETVLLEHQSSDELLARLSDPSMHVIVSVSPQSRASLAAYWGLDASTTARKLTGFLKSLGVRFVLDTSASRDVCLIETAYEFVERYRASHTDSQNEWQQCELFWKRPSTPTGICLSGLGVLRRKDTREYVLPYISTAKSPQAVMGSIVKGPLCRRLGLQPRQVYHCAIMPCYDKKLEASREDFNTSDDSVPETDCVLTSGELQQLAESRGVAWTAMPEAPLDSLLPLSDNLHLSGWPGGSGGYLDFVFRTAAHELFGQTVPPGPLRMRTLRNTDFQEVHLEVNGQVMLRFALAYGFRNIQTLMRKIKRNACEYHYIEIMACPSGCLNGGGQIRAAKNQTSADLLDRLDQVYHGPDVRAQAPHDNPLLQALYRDWIGNGPGSQPAKELLHTQYHARTKPASAAIGDW